MAADLKHDSTELVVLSVLADEAMYGYAITKQIAARSDGEVSLGPSLLYPLLARLEKQGLISSEWEEVRAERNEGRGRRRKWYRLTAKGRRKLAQHVQAHQRYLALVGAFLPGSAHGEAGS
jgi:PadR family transcriptional regulator PadR